MGSGMSASEIAEVALTAAREASAAIAALMRASDRFRKPHGDSSDILLGLWPGATVSCQLTGSVSLAVD